MSDDWSAFNCFDFMVLYCMLTHCHGLLGSQIKTEPMLLHLWKMCFSHTVSPSEPPPVDPRCNLSLDQGTCRNYSIHWYYDKQANSCAQFWYGGCGGNDNRYETEDECKNTCVLYRTGNFIWFWTVNVHIIFFFVYFISEYYTVFSPNRIREETIRKWTLPIYSADLLF